VGAFAPSPVMSPWTRRSPPNLSAGLSVNSVGGRIASLEGEGIDFAPNGWYGRQVGFGYRGVSCGRAICPAPGHRTVARRG